MNRMSIIRKFGLALVCCIGCLSIACNDDDTITPVNLVLDISASENTTLLAVGGTSTIDGIIVIHYQQDLYKAFDTYCPYLGTRLKYNHEAKKLQCSKGSEFNLDGSVIQGPATTPLVTYNTLLSGFSSIRKLRIYPK